MSSATEKPTKAPKVAKAKKPAVKSSTPPTSVMVTSAIGALKERKGSSLIAIKKYIATNYKVDPVKHSHFIKKVLAKAVEYGGLELVKGGGFKFANGFQFANGTASHTNSFRPKLPRRCKTAA